MELPLYPRLNLRTKRFGMETDDIIWVAFYSIVPVFIFQSAVIFLLCLTGSYTYYGIFKHRKPRGWLLGRIYLALSPKTYIAVLEQKGNLYR